MSELIEPSGRVAPEELMELERVVKMMLSTSKKLEGIALCGTLPPGVTGSIYTLVAKMKPKGVILLLDAYQNSACLHTGILEFIQGMLTFSKLMEKKLGFWHMNRIFKL